MARVLCGKSCEVLTISKFIHKRCQFWYLLSVQGRKVGGAADNYLVQMYRSVVSMGVHGICLWPGLPTTVFFVGGTSKRSCRRRILPRQEVVPHGKQPRYQDKEIQNRHQVSLTLHNPHGTSVNEFTTSTAGAILYTGPSPAFRTHSDQQRRR